MTTDLTTYDPTEGRTLVADFQTRAIQRLGEWVHSADAAYQVAERLVQSSFVPAQFKGKPIEATAAILAGSEVGLSPMAALRSFDIIQGQAAARAITLRAVVQSYGHEIVLVESTATRCIMRGRRRGQSEWQTVTWTMDRARDLQLTSKDNWKKQPGAMLVARATSELCRLIAADAILGIGYTAEEVTDGATGEPVMWTPTETESAPAETTTRRMSRAKAEAAPEQEAPTAEGGITGPQSKALHASFNDLGITDRTMRLDYCRNLIGRDIESSNDLTKAEASAVIDALKADAVGTDDPEAGEQA